MSASVAPGTRGGPGALRRPRPRDVLLGAPLVLAAVALAQGPAFLQALHRRHWEDRRFFVHNRANVSTVEECFTRPSAWPGLYRPLTTNCYYLLGRRLWNNRIEVYHAVNLACFAANGLLLLWLCLEWMPVPWASLAAVLFVSRLAHHQLVAHAVEFQSLASVFCLLLASKLFLAGRREGRRALEWLALPVFVAALLSKETAAVWPAIVGLYGWLFDRPSALRRYAPLLGVAAIVALFLALVIRPQVTPEPTGFAYDISAAVVLRYAAYLLVFANPVCWGIPLDADMAPAADRLASTAIAQIAFGLLVLAWGTAVSRARHHPPPEVPLRLALFGFGWFLFAAAPFVILRDRLFMRYSYFPQAGLAIALPALAWAAVEAIRRRLHEQGPLGPPHEARTT